MLPRWAAFPGSGIGRGGMASIPRASKSKNTRKCSMFPRLSSLSLTVSSRKFDFGHKTLFSESILYLSQTKSKDEVTEGKKISVNVIALQERRGDLIRRTVSALEEALLIGGSEARGIC